MPSPGTSPSHSSIFCAGTLTTILHSSIAVSNNLRFVIYRGADNSSTSSGSSGSTDSDKQVTAIFSKDLTVRRSSAQIAYVYYNEDIPEAKYVTFSDPSTFYMKSRMYDVIEKSGDKPLVVPPQASSPVPPRVQESTQTPTTTHADAVPQTAFEPHINATVQPHPTIQPNPTGQAPGKPTPNKNSTWAQVAAKGGAGPRNRS